MKKVVILLFLAMGIITMIMSSPAMSATTTFSLGTWNDRNPPYQDSGMITWTSPIAGTVSISGDASTSSSTDDVWLQYIPQAIAASGLNPGNVLQSGTTHLAAGTVQIDRSTNPSNFGTNGIPLIPPVSSLNNLSVNAGDVIAVLIQNFSTFHGDTAVVNLDLQLSSDFQGSAGTLQFIDGLYNGISGDLKPTSGHAVDVYEFYWSGGNLTGSATTFGIFQNGSSTGGFQDGLKLDLFSVPSASPLASRTILDSTTSDLFNFGSLPSGNYILQLTDMNSNDDPPYNIEFDSPITAPRSAVPEPATMLLLGLGLVGLAGVRRKIQN